MFNKGTVNLFAAGAAVVHFNFRAGSTFPVPVCTVPHGHWVNKGAEVRGRSHKFLLEGDHSFGVQSRFASYSLYCNEMECTVE